jgi:hypothetical protein
MKWGETSQGVLQTSIYSPHHGHRRLSTDGRGSVDVLQWIR